VGETHDDLGVGNGHDAGGIAAGGCPVRLARPVTPRSRATGPGNRGTGASPPTAPGHGVAVASPCADVSGDPQTLMHGL
jgi:hypothetical protein